MERVRENYNWQVQNLREIRHYGTNQVTAVRDQYFEQVSRPHHHNDIQGQIFHFILDGSNQRLFNQSLATIARELHIPKTKVEKIQCAKLPENARDKTIHSENVTKSHGKLASFVL